VLLKVLRLLAKQLGEHLLGYPVANIHGRLLQIVPPFFRKIGQSIASKCRQHLFNRPVEHRIHFQVHDSGLLAASY